MSSTISSLPSGVPDGFRYCIKLEDDGCASYHRFIREDYEAFGF